MSQHVAFVNLPVADYSSLDIGVTVAATHLNERTPHRGSIVDLVFSRRRWQQHLATELARLQPDWVAISTNKLYLHHARKVVDECHQLGYKVVIGGHEATCAPAETLLSTQADAACTGDAETSLVALLDSNGPADAPEGMAGQRIWHGHFVNNLDEVVTPDYSLWPTLEQYRYFLGGLLYVQGTRGCPHRCSYCDAKQIDRTPGGRYYRIMSPRHYVKMLCELERRYHFRLHQCFDPVFTIDPKWVREFASEYHKQGATVPLSVFARIDQLDEERIANLKQANCKVVRVGIESGSEYIRNQVFGRNISSNRIRQVRGLLRKAGIIATAYFIVGAPYETHETIRETINFARELDFERCPIFVYKVLTPEGLEQMKGCGAKLRAGRSDNISFGAAADLPGLSAERLEWYQREAYFWTFGRRLLRLVRAQRQDYFFRFARYMLRGLSYGLDPLYLATYFQVYSGENAFS